MKKLLKKIEVEEQDMESNLEEFERRLKDVMRRYKIENEALASEIVNLHKQSTHWDHVWWLINVSLILFLFLELMRGISMLWKYV